MRLFNFILIATTLFLFHACGEDEIDVTGQFETVLISLSNCSGNVDDGIYGDTRGVCFPNADFDACVRIFWEFRENKSYSRTSQSTNYLSDGSTQTLGGGTDVGTYFFDGALLEIMPASGLPSTRYSVDASGDGMTSVSTTFSNCDATEQLLRI